MNKTQILAALLAAGVTEANETMTVEQLKALAAEKGVALVKEPAGPSNEPSPPPAKKTAKSKGKPPGDDYYDKMRQDKVTAGLPLADAIEVTARQRAEDAANGFTLEATPEESPES